MKTIKQKKINSERLTIMPISIQDSKLVLELFNTAGWLKYIGDRNIHSILDAERFIQKAVVNDNAALWTIAPKDNIGEQLGILTFIKRDFLTYPDLGYALLPNAMKKGYAYEATLALIHKIKLVTQLEQLNAISLPENSNSIKLLKKLHFVFEQVLIENQETVHIYNLKIRS